MPIKAMSIRAMTRVHLRAIMLRLCAITVITPLALLASAPYMLAAKIQDRIVAIVNSDLIMWSEVERKLAPERERLARQHQGEALARRLSAAESMALTGMVERRLQLQEAKARGIDVTDQEVRNAIKQMTQQGEKIDAADPADVKNVREQLMLLKAADLLVRSGVMVANSEAKRYYQEHRDRFALPEEYTLSQILLKPLSPDDLTMVRQKAQEISDALKRGESFEDLTLRYSDGPNAARAGRLGLVRQGELLPAIERSVAKLVPGGISEAIESPEGLHFVRLEDKKPKQYRPYEEVKQEINALVFREKSEDVFQAWLADLKNKAYIEIKFDSVPSARPTNALAPRPSPTSTP